MQTEEKTLYQLDGVMIGKRIKSVRKARGLTQEQLAERCGCTSTHMRKTNPFRKRTDGGLTE